MGTKTFPNSKNGFYAYLTAVVPYLNTYALRLSVDAGKLAELSTLYGNISTAGTYLYYWNLWADKTGGRTQKVIANLDIIKDNLTKILCEIYDDIPVAAWTEDDRLTFGRKTGSRSIPVHPTTPIASDCLAMVIAKGNGRVRVGCKYFSDQSRYSKPKDADGVEIAHKLVPVKYKQGVELVGKVKEMITSPDEASQRAIFPKALFDLVFDPTTIGYELQFFVRWVNTRHPNLAGTWSGPYSVVVA